MVIVTIDHPCLGLSSALVRLPKPAKDILLGDKPLEPPESRKIVANISQLKLLLANTGYRFSIQPVDLQGNPL